MFKPAFSVKPNGMPVISSDELDILGERLVADFAPAAVIKPQEIDIDRFVTKYLNMKLDFQYLSHCGVYLGVTVFQNTHQLPIFNPERKAAEFMDVEAGTIIIDSSLLEESQEHRYRFTMGHESGHSILHPSYFLNTIGEDNVSGFLRCRADYQASKGLPSRLWTDRRRAEQQANRLGSSILMPKSAVKIALARIPLKTSASWIELAIDRVENTFNVSREAAYYRLIDLGYITNNVVTM